MHRRDRARIGLAIVRAVVEQGPPPVIRVIRIDDLFRDEHVLGVTSSPDEAAAMIRDWLTGVLGRAAPGPLANNGPVTPS